MIHFVTIKGVRGFSTPKETGLGLEGRKRIMFGTNLISYCSEKSL